MLRTSRLAVAVLAVASPLVATSARAQTAQLSRSTHIVSEASGAVTIEIVLSAPADAYCGVFLQTKDGAALAGTDYEETNLWVEWAPGESASRYMTVSILDDGDVEPDHGFEVEIVYSNEIPIGSPRSASITILDNDGPGDPIAFVDPMGATENPLGEITFFGPAGGSIDITVKLDRLPSQPHAVDFTCDFEPTSGTLTFDGTNEQTVTVTLPAGHDDFVEGVFSLVGGVRQVLPKNLAGLALLFSTGQITFEDCLVCLFLYYASFAGFDECPLTCEAAQLCSNKLRSTTAATATATLETLRRYRDEVLATTPTGQFYIDFFDRHQANLTEALIARPTFIHRIYRAQAKWVDAIDALVNGNGFTTFITLEMRDDLLALLDEFQELADPDTAAALQSQRTQLQLDGIAGLTMVQFQLRIEILGGLPGDAHTWSSVKAKY